LPPAGAPPPAPPDALAPLGGSGRVRRPAHPLGFGTAAVPGFGGQLTRSGSVRRQWSRRAVSSPAWVGFAGSYGRRLSRWAVDAPVRVEFGDGAGLSSRLIRGAGAAASVGGDACPRGWGGSVACAAGLSGDCG